MSQLPLDPFLAQLSGRRWRDLTFVGFDTETTGKYPLEAEICEIAAVKWQGGKIIETFETLLKPSRPMGEEVIAIHGITNDMVANAPVIADKIGEFHKFIQGTIPVAHHAPFDMGFIAIEFEKAGLALPQEPVLCSSLLSRKLFPESDNHRLQTLIKFFNLEQGTAHRALDDTKACLEVGLRCLQKSGDEGLLAQTFEAQGGPISWNRFSMREIEQHPIGAAMLRAIREGRALEMVYGNGTPSRRVRPHGFVRSLDGDFMLAYDEGGDRSKRFLTEKMMSAAVVEE